jgi:hypothetical protein
VVQVAVGWGLKLQGAEANVVKCLVVDTEGLVRVLDKLVDRERRVVRLHHCVGNLTSEQSASLVIPRRTQKMYLGRRDDGEGTHHPVGILFPDLRDKKGAHTGARTATKRVGDLETLEAVAALGLLSYDIENRVDKLGALGVMALCPVVTGTRLSEDEVVGSEQVAERTRADRVHRTGFQVDQDGARNILAAGSLVIVNTGVLQFSKSALSRR